MQFELSQINFSPVINSRMQIIRTCLTPPLDAYRLRVELLLLHTEFTQFFSTSPNFVNRIAIIEAAHKSFLQSLLFEVWDEQALPLEDAIYSSQILLSQCRNLFCLEQPDPTLNGVLLWIRKDTQQTLFSALLQVAPKDLCNQILTQAVSALTQGPLDDDLQAVTLKRTMLVHQLKKGMLAMLEENLRGYSTHHEHYLTTCWREMLNRCPNHHLVNLHVELQLFTLDSITLSEKELQALIQWLTRLSQELSTILSLFTDPFTGQSLPTFARHCRSNEEFLQNSLCFAEDGQAYFYSSIRYFRLGRANGFISPFTHREMFSPLIPSNALLSLHYFTCKIADIIHGLGSTHQFCLRRIYDLLSFSGNHPQLIPNPAPTPVPESAEPPASSHSLDTTNRFLFFLESPTEKRAAPRYPPGLGIEERLASFEFN